MEKTNYDDQLISSRNQDGKTILHLAAMLKQFETVSYMLSFSLHGEPGTNYLRADVVEPVVESDSAAAPWFKKFKKYRSYQSNRLEEIRGSLMVVAAIMATMSFLAVVRPPGGVWQQDSTNTTSSYSCRAAVCSAGTSVLADANPVAYMNFMASNAVAFVSSLSVILLIVTGVPFRNKLFTWTVITWMMMLSTYALTLMNDGWP